MYFVAYFTYFLTSTDELMFNAVEKNRFLRKLAHWNLHFTVGRKKSSVPSFHIDCLI
jgi:hypothetical protein